VEAAADAGAGSEIPIWTLPPLQLLDVLAPAAAVVPPVGLPVPLDAAAVVAELADLFPLDPHAAVISASEPTPIARVVKDHREPNRCLCPILGSPL
jgi:hypothetical protein